MGKSLNLERKEKRSGMKQVYNIAASAFFFQSHTIFPLLSLPLLVLYPMPSHLLFSCLFYLLSLFLWIRCFDLGSRVSVPWCKLITYAS